MPNVKRTDIDTAVFRYFDRVALDVEVTRAQVAGGIPKRTVEVRALLGQAEREEVKAEGRLARVRRDYTDGKLDADDWASFRDELTREFESARAEVERLGSAVAEVEAGRGLLDAEAETLEKLAAIRQALAGEIQEAEGIEAVRAALLRLFARFVIHVDGSEGQDRSGGAG